MDSLLKLFQKSSSISSRFVAGRLKYVWPVLICLGMAGIFMVNKASSQITPLEGYGLTPISSTESKQPAPEPVDTPNLPVDTLALKTPETPDNSFKAAQAMVAGKKPELALEILDPLLKAYPNNTDYLLLQAVIGLQLNHPVEKMRTTLLKAIEQAPNYADLYQVFLQTCQTTPHQEAPCTAVRQKAREAFPNQFWWYLSIPENTASGKLSSQWLEQDIAAIQHYLEETPGNDEARFLLAKRLVWKEDFLAAMANFEQVLLSQPGNLSFIEGKSWALTIQAGQAYQQNRFKEARKLLFQASSLTPDKEVNARLMVLTCQQIGNADCLTEVSLIDKQFNRPYWSADYRAVLDSSGNLDNQWFQDRMDRLNRALKDNPDLIEALETRARLFGWKGMNQAALKDYNALERLFPGNVEYSACKAKIMNRLQPASSK
jgi:tetratricopeptide (TPR) repeat protein